MPCHNFKWGNCIFEKEKWGIQIETGRGKIKQGGKMEREEKAGKGGENVEDILTEESQS